MNGAGPRAATRAAAAILALAGALGLGGVRAWSEGTEELAASDASRAKGDLVAATVHARRAASAAVPGAPYADAAFARLAEIAADAEARQDREAALFAWHAVRSASFASRWLLHPRERERAQADAAIARLAATSGGGMRERRPGEIERLVAADLAREDVPAPAWRALLVGGAAAAIAAVAWSLARGVTAEGRAVPAVLKRAAWVAAAGVVGMVVALLRG